jgi:hypothetical protein
MNAAQTAQRGAFDPWSSMLSGAGNAVQNYSQSQWNRPRVTTDYSIPMISQEF